MRIKLSLIAVKDDVDVEIPEVFFMVVVDPKDYDYRIEYKVRGETPCLWRNRPRMKSRSSTPLSP